jgi:hypothetical protein
MEQPMMRNEHIVRAHQTPTVAVNPMTGSAWNVIHVDSAAAAFGNGSVNTPYRTLSEAQAKAVNPYDVVFVHTGNSATTPYASTWQFQADNQILVGQGSTLQLNTANCGYQQFFATGPSTAYPLLTSTGDAITLRTGAIVDHLAITGAPVGILADASLAGGANVNDVQITTAAGQTAVSVASVPSGPVNFTNMNVTNAGRGLWVNGGAPDVKFQGQIATKASSDESVLVQGLAGGSVNVNTTTDTLSTAAAKNDAVVATAPFVITDTDSAAPAAIQVVSNNTATVAIGQATVTRASHQGVLVQNNIATQTTFRNLEVTAATKEGFANLSNDAASSLTIDGQSSVASLATALPAFTSSGADTLAVKLRSVQSAVPVTSGTAVSLQGGATGLFTIKDEFLVSGTTGTVANVDQTGAPGVTVTLP